jgi:hypothetical protein
MSASTWRKSGRQPPPTWSSAKAINPDSRLNLCDCAAYALAKSLNVPLLFKGHDFSHTDVLLCPERTP